MPEFRASDGVRLHYLEEGVGSPIVFIHGWMMSGRFFCRQFEGLGHERRCLAPDLRGCGLSETRPVTNHLDRLADDLHELLDHLRLHGVTLVGWSLGGGIAMRYLDRHGVGRVRGVCLIDFPPKFEEDPAVATKVCQKLANEREAFMTGFFKRMFLHEPSVADAAWMRQENAKCASETGCELYRQLGVGDSGGGTYAPRALLAFPRQGWFPKALSAWKQIFPDHIAPEFERSRHCPFLEEPEAFNQALHAFTA